MKGRAVLGVNIRKFPYRFASGNSLLFPDPLFMQFFQELSIEQGVGGSQSGLNLGFVLEF